MSHHHHHHQENDIGRAFKIGIIINVAFIVAEVIYGRLSNSLALLADAGHNFGDVIALIFSWIAIFLAKKKPTYKFTYGLKRSTILIALFNTLIILLAAVLIGWEAINRVKGSVAVYSSDVIIVATIGILINGFTAWLFVKDKGRDINIKSTFLHFVADALVSGGVVAAGIIMFYTDYYWVDSVVSILIVVVITYSSIRLLIEAVNLALDGVPKQIELDKVYAFLSEQPGVESIHDLHVWGLSTTEVALTAHLVVDDAADNELLNHVVNGLHDRFGIEHSTVQMDKSGNDTCSVSCIDFEPVFHLKDPVALIKQKETVKKNK
jgi:cobalt-zinc-cadmium efflux system protein